MGLTILTSRIGHLNLELAPPTDDAPAAAAEPEALPLGQPAPPAATDPFDQIRRLAELRDQGIITDEEFASKKAELLDRI